LAPVSKDEFSGILYVTCDAVFVEDSVFCRGGLLTSELLLSLEAYRCTDKGFHLDDVSVIGLYTSGELIQILFYSPLVGGLGEDFLPRGAPKLSLHEGLSFSDLAFREKFQPEVGVTLALGYCGGRGSCRLCEPRL
jgi:hypothetical protein